MEALDLSKSEEARDPFTLDVIKNALGAIADEMAVTVARTARSFVVKEALDFSTALFNAEGELIAQGTCLPLHMGAMPFAVEAVQRALRRRHARGRRLRHERSLGRQHPSARCGVRETGLPGGPARRLRGGARPPDGHRGPGRRRATPAIRPRSIRRAFVFRRSASTMPGSRSRRSSASSDATSGCPDTVLGDIRSEVAACAIGERQLLDLIGKYGPGPFEAYCQELLDYTERFTRSEIAKLPNGSYRFTDYIDDDGIDPDPIVFSCCITVRGDDLTVDFEGTAPQVRGAINSVFPFTASAAWACVRSVLDGNIPNNAGYFRPIRVKAPKRSIVNADPPSPVAARGLAGFRIADSVMGCLAQIVPDLVPASGGNAPEAGISLGGYQPDGTPFVYLEFLVGSWGGGPRRDGMDACTGIIVNYSNTPVELLETEQPLLVERYAFVEDSGGPGEFRGGLALERRLRFLYEEGIVQVRSDRRRVPPYGLREGAEGAPSDVRIRRAGGKVEQMPSKFLTPLARDDVIEIRLASGGGYGRAFDRDPERVLADVREEKVSVSHAAEAYGVALTGCPLRIDREATRALRRTRGAGSAVKTRRAGREDG